MLNWTTELPKEPGWYWVFEIEKDGNKKDIKVLEVFWAGSDKQKFLMYVLNGYFFFLKEWKDHRFWYMEIENVPSPPSLKE